MKLAIATALGLAVTASQAMAQANPDTLRMSCAGAAQLVRNAGSIVLNSGPNIYDRYVSAQNFCTLNEIMVPRWVPSADNPQCFIGWVCQRESWGAGPS